MSLCELNSAPPKKRYVHPEAQNVTLLEINAFPGIIKVRILR